MNKSTIVLICCACCALIAMGVPRMGLGANAHWAREPTSAHETEIRLGESFLKARSRLFKQGWMPIHMHDKDSYVLSGSETLLAQRKIYEVDSCSMDLGVNCIFYYRKRQECMRIDTLGEEVKDMKISRWSRECPLTK